MDSKWGRQYLYINKNGFGMELLTNLYRCDNHVSNFCSYSLSFSGQVLSFPLGSLSMEQVGEFIKCIIWEFKVAVSPLCPSPVGYWAAYSIDLRKRRREVDRINTISPD